MNQHPSALRHKLKHCGIYPHTLFAWGIIICLSKDGYWCAGTTNVFFNNLVNIEVYLATAYMTNGYCLPIGFSRTGSATYTKTTEIKISTHRLQSAFQKGVQLSGLPDWLTWSVSHLFSHLQVDLTFKNSMRDVYSSNARGCLARYFLTWCHPDI